MISFDKLWKVMEDRNVTTYYLRQKCGISGDTINRLKKGLSVSTNTLNDLCIILECDLNDIVEFEKLPSEKPRRKDE